MVRKRKRKSVSLLCECGCGEFANEGRRFLRGHSPMSLEERKRRSEACKGELNPMYGKRGENASWWGRKHTEETKIRISKTKKGKKLSEEHRKKLSKVTRGKGNPMYGKSHTEVAKKKMSEIKRGKKHTEEAKRKVSEFNKGKKVSKETRKRMSDAQKGEWNPRYGKKASEETKRKMRISRIQYLNNRRKEGGQIHPGYNSNACRFFAQFDRDFNTQGQYAINGGEYYVKALGYWVDYINFDFKLIIEWDEESHYSVDGNLKERDIQRQEGIQEYFSDFTFIRIREKGFQKESLYDDLRLRRSSG